MYVVFFIIFVWVYGKENCLVKSIILKGLLLLSLVLSKKERKEKYGYRSEDRFIVRICHGVRK